MTRWSHQGAGGRTLFPAERPRPLRVRFPYRRRCGALPRGTGSVRAGEVLHRPGIEDIRAHAAAAVASLPEDVRSVSDGPPYLTVNVRGGQP